MLVSNGIAVALSVALVAAVALLGVAWRRTARLRGELDRRAMAEAEYRARVAQLQVTLAGMSDGFMLLDSDMRLREWNAHFTDFTGVPPEILRVGMPIEDILRAQAKAGEFGQVDIEAEVARRTELLRSRESTGVIVRNRPNGRVMELRRDPLPGGGYVTLYSDVTARRRAEDQLRQAQKMEAVGQLTGGVAHDFNNLLMIVLGNLEVAARALEAGNVVQAHKKVEVAQGGGWRAAALTQRLLAFSRQQILDPRPIDANKLVSGMADLVRQSAGAKVQVETVLAGGLWTTIADANQLEVAILNLVINARDAMPGGGTVTIETANAYLDETYAAQHTEVTAGQYVMVAVSDTGSGMSPEVADRAFEPFFTTKMVGKGSGLGLPQVFGFVKQSGGHVKIYSEVDKGTTVKIYMPRLMAEPAPEITEAAHPEDLPHADGKETVLVVEDEADILAYAIEALEELGYKVVGAPDASSALAALETHPDVGLLLTDIGLPGIEGRQLALEAVRRHPDLAVIFTTGYMPNAILNHDDHGLRRPLINKPYTSEALALKVREALDARHASPPADEPSLNSL